MKHLERSKNIIVIDKSGVLRPVITRILTDLRFQSIRAVQSTHEAAKIIERGEDCWIFTYLYQGDDITAFDLLRIALTRANGHQTRISIFFDKTEELLIPFAFEHGMFSAHPSEIKPDMIKNELAILVAIASANHGYTMAAANSLRAFLKREKRYEELCFLNEKIVSYDHGHGSQLIVYAESLLQCHRKKEAEQTLYQAYLFGGSTAKKANEVYKANYGIDIKDQTLTVNLPNCVVLDSDNSSNNQIADTLKKFGAVKICQFETNKDAIAYLSKRELVSLIICEWKQPKVNGAAFVQRARELGYHETPIIVHSSLVEKEDMTLLREIGVSSIVKKPAQDQEITNTVVSTVFQHKYPTDAKATENKFRQLILAGRIDEAKQFAEQAIADKAIPTRDKILMSAEIAFHDGEIEKSILLAKKAFKMFGQDIFILNLLGKACLKLKRYRDSIGFFNRAKALSPKNIERLCTLSEVHAEDGNEADARKYLQEASRIAPDSESIKVTSTKLEYGDSDVSSSYDEGESSQQIEQLVTFLNNNAVSLSKDEKTEEAIESYKQALKALPKGRSKHRTTIRYNVALAYIKKGKYSRARAYLETLVVEKGSPVQEKATSLLRRLLHCMQNKKKLKLREDQSSMELEQSATSLDHHESVYHLPDIDDLHAGDICLYKIYTTSADFPPQFKNLLESEIPETDSDEATEDLPKASNS